MTNNPDLFLDLQSHQGRVKLGDDSSLNITGKGTIALQARLPNGKASPIVLQNVLYVPRLGSSNLLSWRAISSLGFSLVGTDTDLFVKRNGNVVCWGKLEGLDFVLQEMEDRARLVTYDEWHQAFGHVSPSYITPSCYEDGHLIPSQPSHFDCSTCSLSKSTKTTPPLATTRSTKPFELIHSDLSGKFSTQSLGKSLYYITFINDLTRYTWIRFLRHKSDAAKAIKDFIKEIKRQHAADILRFWTDGGGEYINEEVKEFFADQGIIHEVTPPYSHKSNGVAERYNRIITTMVRGMLTGLPLSLWSEAYNTAVYLKNIVSHKAVKESTPYEVLHSSKPLI